jgi:hypothetical protein
MSWAYFLSILRRSEMVKVKKSLLVLVLLVNLAACTFGPRTPSPSLTPTLVASFTPFMTGTKTTQADLSPTPCIGCTQTALAASSPTSRATETKTPPAASSPTPWVAGTKTALALSSASPTPPPFPTSTPVTLPFPTFTPFPLPEGTFTPVFYGNGPFLLVGGIKTDLGWLSGVQAAQYIGNELTYDFFNPDGSIQILGSALEFSPTCRNHFMSASVVLPDPMVGVASGWITEERTRRDLATDDPVYIQVVAEWFQSQGISPTEIHITRILETDIEGDGVNEILLSASFFKDTSGHMTETGDYSIVLMRKVVGNEVLTIPLARDFYVSTNPDIELSFPYTYTLAEVADLNHDGTLEVIVDVRRWEGWGAIVYRVDGLNAREVIRTIC